LSPSESESESDSEADSDSDSDSDDISTVSVLLKGLTVDIGSALEVTGGTTGDFLVVDPTDVSELLASSFGGRTLVEVLGGTMGVALRSLNRPTRDGGMMGEWDCFVTGTISIIWSMSLLDEGVEELLVICGFLLGADEEGIGVEESDFGGATRVTGLIGVFDSVVWAKETRLFSELGRGI
jgi:hypothetical protein